MVFQFENIYVFPYVRFLLSVKLKKIKECWKLLNTLHTVLEKKKSIILARKKSQMVLKSFRNIFLSLNLSNFSKSNLKTNFISQSDIILAFIGSINHTAQVSIFWVYNVTSNCFRSFYRAFEKFFLEWDDNNRANISNKKERKLCFFVKYL